MDNNSPRLHRPLAVAVIFCLEEIFGFRRPADKVLEKCFKLNHRFGSRDRAFIAENVYDITRHFYRISEIISPSDSYWKVFGAWLILQKWNLPEWDEFKSLHPSEVKERWKSSELKPVLLYSIPPELHTIGMNELGNRWIEEFKAMDKPAPMVVRINTLKTDIPSVLQGYRNMGVEFYQPSADIPEAMVFRTRINLYQTATFKKGLVEIQDFSSQNVAHFAQPKAGMRVIDACAGAGGKALHMAALMNNKGKIIAMDTEAYKLDELKKRAARAGADIIETRTIENSKIIKRSESSADMVLLDVPCSGLGVLRRNPDAKYRISPEYLDDLRLKQQKILQDYSSMVKIGGTVIYVTCSILPSENEKQIDTFLQANAQFEKINETHLWPSTSGFDGFYMCRMKRTS